MSELATDTRPRRKRHSDHGPLLDGPCHRRPTTADANAATFRHSSAPLACRNDIVDHRDLRLGGALANQEHRGWVDQRAQPIGIMAWVKTIQRRRFALMITPYIHG